LAERAGLPPKSRPRFMRYHPWSGNFHKIWIGPTQNGAVAILRAMVPGHGKGIPQGPSRSTQLTLSRRGQEIGKDGSVIVPRFSTTRQCASQRPPGDRQNGEAKAGDHNAPQCCGRRIRVGPFGAIQRMFARSHLPLPLAPWRASKRRSAASTSQPG
jgi:hypothetical protein